MKTKYVRDCLIRNRCTSSIEQFRWHIEPPSGFNRNRFKSSFSDNNQSQKPNEQSNDSNEPDLSEFNRSKFPSRTNDSEPIYKALALHNFYGQTNRELSFKKGEIIFVKRRINNDWIEGEHQGLTGIFPLNYVELFPYDTDEQENYNDKDHQIEGEAIVKYDFIPQKTFELQLRKGEKVILLRRLDDNWYEGRLNHIEGIFPADYVDTLKEPTDNSLKQSNQNEHIPNAPKIPKSVLKNSTGLKPTAVEKMNIVPEFSLPMQKCQVLYDYIPQNVDELEIHTGDIINILEMCDDGWYCGVMEKSNHGTNMKFGTFPGNYVKILPT